MAFRVDLSPSALNDAEAAFLWLAKDSRSAAEAWFNGLLEAIYSLEAFPSRCQLAPESRDIGLDIRQLLYKNYRLLFTVAPGDGKVEGVVQILRIRHLAQDRLTLRDL